MRFRPAQQSDLASIISLHVAAWREMYGALLPEDYAEEALEADIADRWRIMPRGDLLTLAEMDVEEEVVPIGFAYVQMDHPDGPFLDGFFVAPDWREDRIDVALFQSLRSGLRMRGAGRLWRLILESDIEGRGFYRALGGRETPPYTEDFFGQRIVSRKINWDRL